MVVVVFLRHLLLFDSFNGEIKDENQFEEILKANFKSEQFLPYAKLIAALTQELNGFYKIGEYVQNVDCMKNN